MESKRIVIKVGTSSLTYPNGQLRLEQIEHLVREIADLVNAGHQVALVSSGAIGAGMSKVGLTQRPKTIPEKQAIAAIGQGLLMQMYSKFFAEYCRNCGQVLLTAEDLQQRNRYLNCRNTLETLLKNGVIPIINENDSVAFDEIMFGDNDTLSAMVANLVSADLLIILSNIDGVYDKNPHTYEDAKLISEIDEITPEIMELAGGSSDLGTGGMVTKFQAAKIARLSGIPMVIANSSLTDVVHRVVRGESVGTFFKPLELSLPSRKRWLAFYTHPHGRLVIDQGAIHALQSGKSLLAAGITECLGNFSVGDLVEVYSPEGTEVAKGLTNYSVAELKMIKGKNKQEIIQQFNEHSYEEVIHRDNLVMIDVLTKGRF